MISCLDILYTCFHSTVFKSDDSCFFAIFCVDLTSQNAFQIWVRVFFSVFIPASPTAQTPVLNPKWCRFQTPQGPACGQHRQRRTDAPSTLASGPQSIVCAPRSALPPSGPTEAPWGSHKRASPDPQGVNAPCARRSAVSTGRPPPAVAVYIGGGALEVRMLN